MSAVCDSRADTESYHGEGSIHGDTRQNYKL